MVRALVCADSGRDSQRYLIALAMGLFLLASCNSAPPSLETDPETVVAPAPAPPKEIVSPKPLPMKPEVLVPDPEPLRMAILLSDDRPQYADVSDALLKFAGPENAEVFSLNGESSHASHVLEALQAAGHEHVVAVGLLAALAAKQLTAEKIVFCQVINHNEHELLGPRRCGVSALPPLDEVAAVWASLIEGPARVGVITGSGHEATVAAAREAFASQGLELVHRLTNSDKETVYEFRRMLGNIGGYWLFPDNRVLSRSAFAELMSLARRARVQVLVNDSKFLAQGGFLSASSDTEDIAKQAYEAMLRASHIESLDGPGLHPLSKSRLQLNGELAKELGLELDPSLQPLLAR